MKVDDRTADWVFITTEWWLREFGPIDDAELILPLDDFFPSSEPDLIFESVLSHCPIFGSDWEFILDNQGEIVLDDPMPNIPRPAVDGAVLSLEDDELSPREPLPIPFHVEDAADPVALVASFATSLSHFLLYEALEPIPGGEENREAARDLGAVLLGFGVFVSNSAFAIRHSQDGLMSGWSTTARGALTDEVLGYATALFAELAASNDKQLRRHLCSNSKASYKWARKEFGKARKDQVQRLKLVTPRGSQGPYR